jgi:hypothetical protein
MASNESTLEDETGDFPDWIEIYNPADTTLNLAGFGISDRADDGFKYTFGDTSIASGGYLVLFASSNTPADSIRQYLHADFKLSASGETIYLFNPDSVQVDSLTFPALRVDEAFGYTADGSGPLILSSATPGAENAATGFSTRLANPTVDIEGGFYTRNVTILQTEAELAGMVHYTTDGTDPTASSPLFDDTNGLTLSATTLLKLRAFSDAQLPSDVITHTYFVNVTHTLPVVSLVTDPDYFFDEDTGIYVHYEDDIEVPAHIEFYEPDGSLAFQSHIGTRIYGAYSRRWDQKSLAIYFRGQYGLDKLDYRLFEEKDIDEFQSFVLRNAGNDFGAAHIRDGSMSSIIEKDIDIDYQAYRPSVLYLNGEYWGVMNIREKLSEHFLAENRGVDPDNVDIVEVTENPTPNHGSVDAYLAFIAELEEADLSIAEEYNAFTKQMDLDNYIDYMAIQIYYANTDWPGNNNKAWKERTANGKWRWFLYDLEHGFNLYSGAGDYNLDMISHTTTPTSTTYSNPEWATLLFRKLLQNDDFKRRFITRISDLMSTVFQTDHMLTVIDSIATIVRPEMEAHENRWNMWNHPFEEQVEDMRHFARNRTTYMRQHLTEYFRLRRLDSLTVDISGPRQGNVIVNRAEPHSYPWTGLYYDEYEIQLTAVPNTGYRFTGWSGDVTSGDSIIWVENNTNVTANFEFEAAEATQVVINEIMYNAPDESDSGDWVELHNTTDASIDISGWILKDEDDTHSFEFPIGTSIAARGFLVVAQELASFNQFYTGVTPLYGDMGFGLAGGSDDVRLFNTSGELVDGLTYDDEDPWDANADGTGFSLELKNPALDNSLAENWQASSTHMGTPGAENSVLVSAENEPEMPAQFILNQNYPNPFNPSTIISYQLSNNARVKVTVFDALGRQVAELLNEHQPAGYHQLTFNAGNLASGVYVYRVEADNQVMSKRMLLIK